MEGKNKKIEQETPAASAWPKSSNEASPFAQMSPSNLPPLAPSSFRAWQKPYCMSHVGAGGSSSGTQISSDQNLTLQTSPCDNIVNPEAGNAVQGRRGRDLDPNMDPKKLKRVMSNRLSAQKSRVKKLQHVYDMERKAEHLETVIALLSPQVAQEKEKKYLLQMEQNNLKQRINACANRKMIVDAEIEEKRAEISRLRQLYAFQQQQKMQAQASNWSGWEHEGQMVNPGLNPTMYPSSVQVDAGENAAEIDRLNQLLLNQQLRQPGQTVLPGWAPGAGQQTNVVGSDQSGPGQVPNPTTTHQPKQHQTGSFNPDLGGIEQIIMNINAPKENSNNPRK
ncbi:hypothetical protein DITRI_Ditri05aG0008700 [Diplodiscus trichospermus]